MSSFLGTLGLLGGLLVPAACAPGNAAPSAIPTAPRALAKEDLPKGVRVFQLSRRDPRVEVWYARIRAGHPGLSVRAVSSTDDDGLETVSEFAQRTGAVVALNGGLFGKPRGLGKPLGLLVEDGELLRRSSRFQERDGERYPIARAALGVDEDGDFDIAWVSGGPEGLFAWDDPWDNAPGRPCEPPKDSRSTPWEMEHVVQAGPRLLCDGEVLVTSDEEVINPTLRKPHPRSAAGITAEGDLILMVVDGRRSASRGVRLGQLARLMQEVGCVEAVNLDGGGSSALAVLGQVVNVPNGTGEERQVQNAIVVIDERR